MPRVPVPPWHRHILLKRNTEMGQLETLPGGLVLELGSGCFPLGTDTLRLAEFVRLRGAQRVADLGSGCGTLGLLLCDRYPTCTVTGLELQPEAHAAALANIRRNQLVSRMQSLLGDLRQVRNLLPAGRFDCVVSNPPYFPTTGAPPASRGALRARREDCCPLEAIFQAAAWLLRYGGDLYLVHQPERLTDLMFWGRALRLEPKRLRLVRHRAAGPVSLILLQYRLGAGPGLHLESDLVLSQENVPPCNGK